MADRFWRFVDKSGDCWLWTGSKDKDGYGKYAYTENGIRLHKRAHRVSYEMAYGPIPDGWVLDHKCRVRSFRKFPISSHDLNYILSSPISNKEMSEEFGVHPSTICKIRRGQRRING